MSQDDIEATKAPLMEHLVELRRRLIWSLAAIGVGFSYLRSDDREKRLALYELLTGGGDGRERGLRWLIDEIASWDMLA